MEHYMYLCELRTRITAGVYKARPPPSMESYIGGPIAPGGWAQCREKIKIFDPPLAFSI